MSPPVLSLKAIRVAFADQVLIDDAELSLGARDRLCLLGRNGAGKSTLLRIAAGLVEPDGGERFVKPGTRVAYLSQAPDFGDAATLRDYVCHDDVEHYQAEALLGEVGLDPDASPTKLSGGEGRKAAIARLFALEPEVMLLDEPTNHLDLPTIEWLEEKLRAYSGAIIVISHDRAFLRRLTAGCLWIDRGEIRRLDKGFAHFDEWVETLAAEEEQQQHKLKRLIDEETRWSREGISARRKRNQGRLRRLADLREQRAKTIAPTGKAALALESGEASGTLVIEAEHIAKSWPLADGGTKPVIKDFSTRILRGDKLGIVGPNGAGKSTLLKILMGDLAPDAGTVRLGTQLTPIIVDQNRASLNPEATLWETLCEGGGDQVMVRGRPRHVVSYLRDFLFRESQARQPVKALSGGEQNRLLLARAFAKPSNLLVLDEPTNDLDMDTLDVLQDVLSEFDGTLLMVSHDRDFLDRLVTSVIVMDGEGATEEYPGGYTDNSERIHARVSPKPAKAKKETASQAAAPKPKPAKSGKLSYKDERELARLADHMPKLQEKIGKLHKSLDDASLYTRDPEGFARMTRELEAAEAELEAAEETWLELEMKREELQNGG